mmetsp:Transcript_10791/g.23018  ORF Transcript_10791/g.23018 Transcript_10791/m.23018 type:complete len:84 (+) Transcript_10791:54-305(+)
MIATKPNQTKPNQKKAKPYSGRLLRPSSIYDATIKFLRCVALRFVAFCSAAHNVHKHRAECVDGQLCYAMPCHAMPCDCPSTS